MTGCEYLGIEGGGTRTVAVVVGGDGKVLRRRELGPGNVRLLTDSALAELFSDVAQISAHPQAVGIGMAGARDEADRRRIRNAVERVWESVPSVVTHDLEIALAAAENSSNAHAKVLVLSGTGSCCYGRSKRKVAKLGGWGHLLGDVGSGFAIAHRALREVVFEFDRLGKRGPLLRRILEKLLLNEPNQLIGWVQTASKAEIAALASVVFEAKSDPAARKVLARAAESLAADAILCARRIVAHGGRVNFVMAGGVLLRQGKFARQVGKLIRDDWPEAEITFLANEGAWGAARMAREASASVDAARKKPEPKSGRQFYTPEFVPSESPTEQRNPRSTRFHELTVAGMVALMISAERDILPALRGQRAAIVRAAELAAVTLKKGGRIFYVGAGTSGRLGVLDASECPPTFRTPPEWVQGIIAGGQRALWQAVEGAEDDAEAGMAALVLRSLSANDLVVGIAASGRTPFVWGALGLARKVRARTVLLCFNPALKIARPHRPHVIIAPNVGPEVLTGSTRLKCGTATKLILNMISTIAMVRLGKVISNLMVDLNPSNTKLRDRAVRIVQELTGASYERAATALEKNGWVVKKAWSALKRQRAI